MSHEFPLPDDLPVPTEDGAAGHFTNLRLPRVALPATSGQHVTLANLPGRVVVYAYPRTGVPGEPLPPGWDAIPGARGCTPESCGFRDLHAELLAAGAGRVFGLSTQTSDYQREVVDRLSLPSDVLSDAAFELTDALGLPTFEVAGMRLLRRLTLVLSTGRIEHVFYPILPPDQHAEEVLGWLRARTLGVVPTEWCYPGAVQPLRASVDALSRAPG